jgi:flavin reductase (DIM6/NTAB) family NADH-FMN oxidoreductase RutF
VDEAAKKRALRMIPYGLYVCGARQGDKVHAFLLTWLSQCSFKPPLVMMGLLRTGTSHDMILQERVFSVNFLAKDQKAIAASFLKHAVLEGDRLNGHGFSPGKTGCPILEEAAAFVECRVLHHWSRGDHTVIVGEVVEAGVRRASDNLTHLDTGWHYGG